MGSSPKGVRRVRRCPNRACKQGWVPNPNGHPTMVKCDVCGGRGHIVQRYAR